VSGSSLRLTATRFILTRFFSFGNRQLLSKHQVALDFTKDFAVLGDGIPPVPIIFKQEKEQEEKNQNDMLCNQRTETDSDDKDATIYYSSLEDVSTDSSGRLLKIIT